MWNNLNQLIYNERYLLDKIVEKDQVIMKFYSVEVKPEEVSAEIQGSLLYLTIPIKYIFAETTKVKITIEIPEDTINVDIKVSDGITSVIFKQKKLKNNIKINIS